MLPRKLIKSTIATFFITGMVISGSLQARSEVASHDVRQRVFQEVVHNSASKVSQDKWETIHEKVATIKDIEACSSGRRIIIRMQGNPLYDMYSVEQGKKVIIDFYNAISCFHTMQIVPADRTVIRSAHITPAMYGMVGIVRIEVLLGKPCLSFISKDEENVTLDVQPISRMADENPTQSEITARLNSALDRYTNIMKIEKMLFGADGKVGLDLTEQQQILDKFQKTLKASKNVSQKQAVLEQITFCNQKNSAALAMCLKGMQSGNVQPAKAKAERKALCRAYELLTGEQTQKGNSFQTVEPASVSLPLQNVVAVAAPADNVPVTEAKETQDKAKNVQPELIKPKAPGPRTKETSTILSSPKEFKPISSNRSGDGLTKMPKKWTGDPLYQPVNLDFRNEDIANVVGLLGEMAHINVIAGKDVTVAGKVTVYLQNVPLIQAMETVLRMEGLGIVEEEGIFRIVTYEEAVEAKRMSKIIKLTNGQADDIEKTLKDVIKGMPNGDMVSVASSPFTNTIIISGPNERVAELERLVRELDVEKPKPVTQTRTLKLNYADTDEVVKIIQGMITPDVGSVQAESRSRTIIVTDIPPVLEQVASVVDELDVPVKMVAIEGMIVDVVLRDSSATGVTWLLDLVRRRDENGNAVGILNSRRHTFGMGSEYPVHLPGGGIYDPRFDQNIGVVGSLQDLNMGGNMTTTVGGNPVDAARLAFGWLTSDFDLRGAIEAEVAKANAKILANPVISTMENKPATLGITQEYPYQDLTQTSEGSPMVATSFKDIGTVLTVTPRVTSNNDVIVDVDAKQSSVSGVSQLGIPIEDKRESSGSVRIANGQTIFLGGLRHINDVQNTSKIPLLGDIPGLNVLFKSTDVEKTHTELMIFLSCDVSDDYLPELTEKQKQRKNLIKNVEEVPNSEEDLLHSITHPKEFKDPYWKWKRPADTDSGKTNKSAGMKKKKHGKKKKK